MESKTLDVLSAIIFNQLALEKNEALIGSVHYKGQLRPKLQAVTKYLEPIQLKEYTRLFEENPDMVVSCVFHVEKVVEFITKYRLDELIFLASLMEAHRLNPKAIEGIMNKVLNHK